MSVTALLVLAAEEAEHTPIAFYVGGGILAGWGVLLAAVGLARPDFPESDGTAKGLYGLSALLVIAAAATAILSG
ncbi:MAG: hypothetical protein H0V81_11760 [Solirubrobacterales bacterium]|nr:hypothetical protein [Solirubrobacterales bacterium]